MLSPSLLSLPQPSRHITDGPSASLHMTSNCVLFPLPSSLSDLKECYRFFADCFCNVPWLKQIKSSRTNSFRLYTKKLVKPLSEIFAIPINFVFHWWGKAPNLRYLHLAIKHTTYYETYVISFNNEQNGSYWAILIIS